MKAKRVFSANIKFIRGNIAGATQNQQFLVTAVGGWRFHQEQNHCSNFLRQVLF
jgi:hypothetical protein